MADSLQRILADAKTGKYSSINALSDDDVANVWENVGAFIEKKMASQKGVHIPNLGTFSFSQNKLDVGNNKYVLMQRPVFNVSEKFAQTHGLQFTKYTVPGHIPCPLLNYAALSFESPFDRDTVESCVREILSSLARAVAAKKNVELTFAGIGRLQIRESRVKMRFYKEFITQMDGSGTLLDSMQNRAGTVDSVMSNRPFSRPNTSNTVLLPKIQTGPGNPGSNTLLPPVAEVDENQNYSLSEDAINPGQLDSTGVLQESEEAPIAGMPEGSGSQVVWEVTNAAALDNVLAEGDVYSFPVDDAALPRPTGEEVWAEKKAAAAAPTRGPSRTAMPMAMASGISLLDDLVPPPPPPPVKQSPAPPPPEPRAATQAEIPLGMPKPLKPPTPPRLAPLARCRSSDDMLHSQRTQEKRGGGAAGPTGGATAPTCGHHHASQELCFLCDHRRRLNVPVSFTEERKRREEEEGRILYQYHTMKDAEDSFKEQERTINRRHDLQKIAAFNMGVSEVVNARKKAKDTNPQVETKKDAQVKEKTDNDFMERLEQVQLAEDLAQQRNQFIKDKEDQVNMYKKALDVQVQLKPLPMPARLPDNEVFGKGDITNEIQMEKRRRAQLLFQEQHGTVEQKKREAILKQLSQQKRDEFVLKKTREALIEDRVHNYRTRTDHRRQLEKDWRTAAETKRTRDQEERRRGLESGNLLLEQCDRYRRCHQCQRRVTNCGETNVWCESYYVPGSSIMV
ncbi:hypothetical protein ACOMHN_019117 [Nucella lapillus]